MLFQTTPLSLAAAALGTACLLSVASAADLTVTARPVRYCSSTNWLGFCNGRSYPWGGHWESKGIPGGEQDKIVMAYLSAPPARAAARNIVFTTSGQQGSSGGNDYANVVSGFKDGWSWNTKLNGSEPRSLDGRSLAVRFKEENGAAFATSNTVYITVANSMFNHMMSSSKKNDYLQAYTDFLGSHVYWHNIENIYFGGSSRGGCLVVRLAKKLMDDSSVNVSNAKFTVNNVDGVCKYTQNEYGTTSSTLDNPNSPNSTFKNYKARKTGIDDQVATAANKRQMCMRSVVGGDEVTNVGLGVRAFTHEACSSSSGCSLADSNGDVYYRQTWHDIEHTDFGRSYSFAHVTVENFLDFYEGTCKAKWAPPTPSPTPPPTPPPIGPIDPVRDDFVLAPSPTPPPTPPPIGPIDPVRDDLFLAPSPTPPPTPPPVGPIDPIDPVRDNLFLAPSPTPPPTPPPVGPTGPAVVVVPSEPMLRGGA